MPALIPQNNLVLHVFVILGISFHQVIFRKIVFILFDRTRGSRVTGSIRPLAVLMRTAKNLTTPTGM